MLVLLSGLYAACWGGWVGHAPRENSDMVLSIGDGAHVSVDHYARAVVIYSDKARGPYRPYFLVEYIDTGITNYEWFGFYYFDHTWSTGYRHWTLGVSLLYFIAPLVLLLAFLEYRAAIARKRHKENACPACGYLRQGLQTQTMHCPECGHDLYPRY